MTDEQRERYARHLVLKDMGEKGQEKLLKGKVLIIGAGGLGSACALYLGAAGVGTIGIADGDEVDLSNLQRQIIHGMKDIGRPKVDSAKESVNAINTDVKVETYHCIIDMENIAEIIKDYDFIIDATDNFDSKFLINDACVYNGKPLCHGAILEYSGQVMTYVPGCGPSYRDVFKNPPPKGSVPTGRKAGVIGAVPGVIGSLQAMEAIKYIAGIGELLTGRLLTFDALKSEFRSVKLPNR